MASRAEQKRRLKLFRKQRGLCYWCRHPMKLDTRPPPEGRPMNPRICTLDHLHDRWNPLRALPGGGAPQVAACLKCNNERSAHNQRRALMESQITSERSNRCVP